jgi:hypothetical protein
LRRDGAQGLACDDRVELESFVKLRSIAVEEGKGTSGVANDSYQSKLVGIGRGHHLRLGRRSGFTPDPGLPFRIKDISVGHPSSHFLGIDDRGLMGLGRKNQ